MASTLGGVVEFLTRFGLFDVVLPFILVFTIVFAIFEKTRILGEYDSKKPKSNLNAMVAFVFGLVFVTATKLVVAMNIALPMIVVMLLAIICILLIIGSFFNEGEFNFMTMFGNNHKGAIVGVAIIGVLAAFIYAMGWMTPIINWISNNWNTTAAASIFFGILMVVLIGFIVGGGEEKKPSTSSSTEKKN
ncbi:MAG: hypothetical protein WC755_01760 [Candidatus Woesearchaeota archaeon]|jgi:hypothetical protein